MTASGYQRFELRESEREWLEVLRYEDKYPTLYPVEGCGQCAEIAAAHFLTGGCYETMRQHLENHVLRPGRLWGTRAKSGV